MDFEDDQTPINMSQSDIDAALASLPGATISPTDPTMREAMASTMLGEQPSGPQRNFVRGLLGSEGAGKSSFSLSDLLPVNPLSAQENARQGDYQGAVMSLLPFGSGASGVAEGELTNLAKSVRPFSPSTIPKLAEIRTAEKSLGTPAISADAALNLSGMYDQAKAVKPTFDNINQSIADNFGGQYVSAALKGTRRAVEKTATDYAGDPTRVKDLVRGTIMVDSPQQAQAVVNELQNQHNVLDTGYRNLFDPSANPVDGYRDAKMNVNVNGHNAEIQVNVPEMLEAKKQVHDLYEQRRSIEGSIMSRGDAPTPTEQSQIDKLNQEMKSVYDEAYQRALARSDNTNALNRSSVIGTPLRRAESGGKARGGLTSQAAQYGQLGTVPSVTGSPSTSKYSGLRGANITNTSEKILPNNRMGRKHGGKVSDYGLGMGKTPVQPNALLHKTKDAAKVGLISNKTNKTAADLPKNGVIHWSKPIAAQDDVVQRTIRQRMGDFKIEERAARASGGRIGAGDDIHHLILQAARKHIRKHFDDGGNVREGDSPGGLRGDTGAFSEHDVGESQGASNAATAAREGLQEMDRTFGSSDTKSVDTTGANSPFSDPSFKGFSGTDTSYLFGPSSPSNPPLGGPITTASGMSNQQLDAANAQYVEKQQLQDAIKAQADAAENAAMNANNALLMRAGPMTGLGGTPNVTPPNADVSAATPGPMQPAPNANLGIATPGISQPVTPPNANLGIATPGISQPVTPPNANLAVATPGISQPVTPPNANLAVATPGISQPAVIQPATAPSPAAQPMPTAGNVPTPPIPIRDLQGPGILENIAGVFGLSTQQQFDKFYNGYTAQGLNPTDAYNKAIGDIQTMRANAKPGPFDRGGKRQMIPKIMPDGTTQMVYEDTGTPYAYGGSVNPMIDHALSLAHQYGSPLHDAVRLAMQHQPGRR